MSELERYLKRATRGLWGRARRTVWNELETNIRQMALGLEVGGLPREAALAAALREFGRPEAVAVGMARVHTAPALRPVLLAAVLASAAVVALGPRPLPLEVPASPVAAPGGGVASLRLDLPALRRVLLEAGVRADDTGRGLTFTAGRAWAHVPWPVEKAGSAAPQRRGVDIYSVFNALRQVGVELGVGQEVDRVAFEVRGRRFTVAVAARSARAWHEHRAGRWAGLSGLAVLEPALEPPARLEGRLPGLESRTIVAVAYLPQRNGPARRVVAFSRVGRNGRYRLELPAGTYRLATLPGRPLESAGPTLLLGVRSTRWTPEATETHRPLPLAARSVVLAPGETTLLQ